MSETSAYAYRAGEAELRWMGDTSTYFLATGALTGGAFALVDERAVEGETVPLHRHAADVESFYVLDGEVTFFLGDEAGVTVGAGSFVHVPAGEVHGFRIASEAARYLILTTPHHGDFYRAISLPSGVAGGPPPTPIDGTRIHAAAQEYGIEFVGALPEEA